MAEQGILFSVSSVICHVFIYLPVLRRPGIPEMGLIGRITVKKKILLLRENSFKCKERMRKLRLRIKYCEKI